MQGQETMKAFFRTLTSDHLPIDAAGTALSDSNILFASILQKLILLLLNMFPVISVSVFESYLILT